MDVMSTIESIFVRGLDQDNRPLTLRFAGQAAALFDGVVAPQRLEVTEGICESTVAYITCLSTSHALPLDQFKGLPIEIGMVTDVGELRRFNVIVQEVRQGQSDGALTVLQLKAGDIFSLMDGRRSNRLFLNKSPLDIARIVLDGWRSRYPALAEAFDYLLLDIDETQYPPRALTFQAHQTDSEFLRMLFKRNGISWFFRPGHDALTQELVLFDNARQLPANSAGTINYHRRDGTEPFDTISLLAPTHTLVGGQVTRRSWDHETGAVDVAMETSVVDQGERGNEVASALVDARIELPHSGDSSEDHRRLTMVDMQRQEGRAKCLHGLGGVRAQAVGEWNRIDGYAMLDALQPEDREYITVQLSTWCENNFPKELKERTQSLLATSESSIRGWNARSDDLAGTSVDTSQRHVNKFVAVRRDVPILPTWDPQLDLPRMGVMTATVVGAANTPVWCDELGRVKVSIHGLDPEDHAHAGGAGTNGDDGDSAWVRVNFLWCGDGFGMIFPLRPGMEVILGFEHGDPSRPMIVGTRYNATQMPPKFDHLGGLPKNVALSGIVTCELNGSRQQQLRFNDTPGSISVQLGTDHAATQLNIGALSTPMSQGKTEPRGEGGELRSDAAIAVRGGQGVLISSSARAQGQGHQLDRQEMVGLSQSLCAVAQELEKLANTYQAGSIDVTNLQQWIKYLQDWEKGSSTAPLEKSGGAPIIAVGSDAGAGVVSQDNLFLGAQTNVDITCFNNTQVSAGKRLIMRCGDLFSAFAAGAMKLISKGRMDLQADDIHVTARNFTLNVGELVLVQAQKIRYVVDGAQVDIGGGQIVQQSSGPHVIKSASFAHSSGGDGSPAGVKLPSSSLKADEQFVFLNQQNGNPIAGRGYRATMDDGRVIEGRTDEQGRTQLAQSEKMGMIDLIILPPAQ